MEKQGLLKGEITRKDRAVARWLLLGVAMLIVQIWLGGTTRLTGSGLSITEWKPLLKIIPPLNENDWQSAFTKYQQIAQYKEVNPHFTLADFKGIYFWEWIHREWALLVAVVFIVGFTFFLLRGYFHKRMIIPFVNLFILGAMQGRIGWIMVKSGLNETDLYVSHIRLAVHFMAALVLLCYTLWFALQLIVPQERRINNTRLFRLTTFIIFLLGIQLVYGAFMAGLHLGSSKAATVAPTWPDINGQWIPANVSAYKGQSYQGIERYVDNPIAIHFIHRTLAYFLLLMIAAWFAATMGTVKREGSKVLLARARWWPLLLVFIQVLLGIFTLLQSTRTIPGRFGAYEWLAEAHQLVAMCLLIALFVNLYAVRRQD